MIVTAWTNGSTGYGFKIAIPDRDEYFSRQWERVYLHLPGGGEPFAVNVAKASFWNGTCRELIHRNIRAWLVAGHYVPWPKGHPPKFELDPLHDNNFRIIESVA